MTCSTPGFSVHHCLPEFAQTHVRWVDVAIQPSHPLSPIFSSCLQSFPASGSFPVSQFFASSGQSIGVLASAVSPSNEYPGLISFRIDWLDLLAVQGTLKSLLQHHSLKASILWHSVFFMVQLSHTYMTTGKTIALTIQIFVNKVMSLLLKTLAKFDIAILARIKYFMVAVNCPHQFWSPRKWNLTLVETFSPSIWHEWQDWMPWS